MAGSVTVNPLQTEPWAPGPQGCGCCQAPLHSLCTPCLIAAAQATTWPIHLSKITSASVESPEQLCKVTCEALSLPVTCWFSVAEYFPRRKAQCKAQLSFPTFILFPHCHPTLHSLPLSLAVLFQPMELLWLSPLCPNLKAPTVSRYMKLSSFTGTFYVHPLFLVCSPWFSAVKKTKKQLIDVFQEGRSKQYQGFWQYGLTHKNDWGNREDWGRALPQKSDLHKGKVLYSPWDWL